MSATSKWQHAIRLSKWRVVVEQQGRSAKVFIPSLGLCYFDRKGQISVPKLQSLFTEIRLLAYHMVNPETQASFLEYDRLTSDRFTFMASSRSWFARDLFKTPTTPSLAVNLELGYVGSASLNSRAQLVDTESGTVFAENINQVVSVSKQTRKPIALPDWWTAKYGELTAGVGKLVVPPMEVDSQAHKYPVRVTWGNTDGYGHTNYVAYLRFCYDAAMDAIHNNVLEKFHDDICCYETKEVQMSYKNECMAGDDLVISVWPNVDDPYKLHFSIDKDKSTIFQCTIEFYEPRLQ